MDGLTTKDAKTTKMKFDEYSHRVMIELRGVPASPLAYLLLPFALFVNFVVNQSQDLTHRQRMNDRRRGLSRSH